MAVSSGCDKVYESGIIPTPHQSISGAIEIGTDWVEITPPQPLKPITESAVKIQYSNSDVHDSFSDDGTELILADGRKTKIEAILYDDKGKDYELGIVGSGSGIHFGLKPVNEIKDGRASYSFPDFPKDKVFVKLRVRSRIPLKCDNIEWINTVRH